MKLRPMIDDIAPVRRHRRRRLKSVAVLPTLLTLGNLLCGFAAIYFCMRSVYGVGAGQDPYSALPVKPAQLERYLSSFLALAAWCLFAGMLFDGLDGRVARISGSASKFGTELDSLADIVTFGTAPAVLAIALMINARHELSPLTDHPVGRARWMLVALYVACAGMRLARFNVETSVEESHHLGFKGLPSPAAAGVIASLVALHERLLYPGIVRTWLPAEQIAAVIETAIPFAAGLLGLLMVSRMNYTHVVSVYLRERRPIGHLVVALAAIVVVLLFTEATAAVLFSAYAMSGPVRWVFRRGHTTAPPGAHASGPTSRPAPSPADSERIA